MKRIWKGKKALSPVVAAIILIAVTVAVSIAVAAWMGALTIGFMSTEEINFMGCTFASDLSYANLTVKNGGTAALTVDRVLINNYANNSSPAWTVWPQSADETLDPAEEITLQINASKYPSTVGTTDGKFSQGDDYAFTVVTSKNNQFGPYTKAALPS